MLQEGDSYVVLHTYLATDVEGEETDKLLYDIHFWLGRTTPIDAAGTAAYKTVELDDLLDGRAKHHREVMGSESAAAHSSTPPMSLQRMLAPNKMQHLLCTGSCRTC